VWQAWEVALRTKMGVSGSGADVMKPYRLWSTTGRDTPRPLKIRSKGRVFTGVVWSVDMYGEKQMRSAQPALYNYLRRFPSGEEA